MLAPDVAQEIATGITAAIGHNVLVTDHEARVIGSPEPARLGTLHEASLEVVRTRQGAAHDEAAARRLTGVKAGVTLPLFLGRELVGTVGITGDPETVRPFGEIVRRQTEMMLRQTTLLRTELLRERALEQLVQDIGQYEPGSVDAEALHTRAEELGFRLDIPRAAVVLAMAEVERPGGVDRPGNLAPPGDLDRQSLRLHAIRTVREVFTSALDLVAAVGPDAVIVLADARSRRDTERDCRRAVGELKRRFNTRVWAGVGSPAPDLARLARSYHQAWSALRLGRRIAPDRPLHHAHDYRVWELVVEVSPRERRAYRDALLSQLSGERSWPELRRTVVAWVENGNRPVETAKALHIHRNTLQYRLERIRQIAGEDIREPRTALALYLACLADELDA